MDAIDVANRQRAGRASRSNSRGTAQNAPERRRSSRETELQRPGLLLLEGVVYAGFGSDCDDDPLPGLGVRRLHRRCSQGALDLGDGRQRRRHLAVRRRPHLRRSRHDPVSAPATAARRDRRRSGHRRRATSASRSSGCGVQPDGSLKATDFFAPFDAAELTAGTPTSPPAASPGCPTNTSARPRSHHLAVAVGKDGYVYLLNREDLGGIGEGPRRHRRRRAADRPVRRRLVAPGRLARAKAAGSTSRRHPAARAASGSAGNLRVYQYGVSGTGCTDALAAGRPPPKRSASPRARP